MEKMKKRAIFFCLNNLKALKPKASYTDLFFVLSLMMAHFGNVS